MYGVPYTLDVIVIFLSTSYPGGSDSVSAPAALAVLIAYATRQLIYDKASISLANQID